MKLPTRLDKEKQELSKTYSKEDFEELFNEVAGEKKISEDKFKSEFDKDDKKSEKPDKQKKLKNNNEDGEAN